MTLIPRSIAMMGLTTGLLFLSVSGLGGQSLRFADGLTYNDFYTVAVELENGEEFILFDTAFIDGEAPPWPDAEGNFGEVPGSGPQEEMKYFFWVRRLGAAGAVTYPLSFQKIQTIRFIEDYQGPKVPFYTPVELELTNGVAQDVLIKSDGFLGGIDEEFGTYALMSIRHDGITQLSFQHDGSYARCPECGAIFFNDGLEFCTFDGTELLPSLDGREGA